MFNKMYPYSGFSLPNDVNPPNLFHTHCKHTKLTICTCPLVPVHKSTLSILPDLSIDLDQLHKYRKLEKERIVRLPVYPCPPVHSHIKLESQICDYCQKLVSNFQKVSIEDCSYHLCRDCHPQEAQNKKSLSLSARKKKFGRFLDLGTTQSDLSRRGRPRIHSRDDDFIQCYFPKCLKRSLKINEPNDLLTCKKCTRTFHAGCADPPLKLSLVNRFPWYCLECKICGICNRLREESHVLICDACDRVFHSKCLKVSISGSFLCQDCVSCRNCKKVLENPAEDCKCHWVHGFRYCDECFKFVLEKMFCPVCVMCYNENTDECFIMCDHCMLWVHGTCEKLAEEQVLAHEGKPFTCTRCRNEMNNKERN